MESRLRMLLVLAGLPEPVVNLSIRDEDGMEIRRYDLSWPEVRVVVEYDGRHHVERIEQWESDLQRREAIDDDDWRILVVVAAGVYKRPEETLQRVFRCPHRARHGGDAGSTQRRLATTLPRDGRGGVTLRGAGFAVHRRELPLPRVEFQAAVSALTLVPREPPPARVEMQNEARGSHAGHFAYVDRTTGAGRPVVHLG